MPKSNPPEQPDAPVQDDPHGYTITHAEEGGFLLTRLVDQADLGVYDTRTEARYAALRSSV